jgi:hypothetical protein
MEELEMPMDWREIPIDTVLNSETANTAEIGRYNRILQHLSAEATNGLVKQLQGVSQTIYRASQLAEARAEKVIPKMDLAITKADEAIEKAAQAATAQARQQRAMKWLTITLVACTVAYTLINAWVGYEMREANTIQAQVAEAAKEQASAARDANDIQRRLRHLADPIQTK